MAVNNSFIFILGMHRSGTSCLAGSLKRCGLFLGEVSRAGRFNARGNHELKAVMHLHDQILAMNRSFWHRPPSRVQVHPYHQQALKVIAEQLSKHRPCGLKDPRLLLLLDTWLEIVSPPYALVGTFRHPMAVSESLARRDGILEDEALDLWLKYNAKLIQWHQAAPFPLIEFDLSDAKAYRHTVADLSLSLGLTPNRFQLHRFVSQKLEHHRFVGASIPPACQEAYTYLRHHRFRLSGTVTKREWLWFNRGRGKVMHEKN